MIKTNDFVQGDEILEIIKQKIISGEIQHGHKINQNLLAKELNVSRTPIIKALNKLETEGLVDNIPNMGFFLHTNSLKEMAELFEIRQTIEMISAANAAKHASDEDIEAFRQLFEPFQDVELIDTIEYLEADRVFHGKLLTYCDNQRLMRLNQSMQIYHQSYVFGLIRAPKVTLVEHMEIIDAISRRDARSAKYSIMNHLDYTGEYLRSAVEKLKALGFDPNSIPFSSTMMDKV